MKSIKLTHCFLLGSIAILTGCETLQTQDAPVAMGIQSTNAPCRADCRVEIGLPTNPRGRPNASVRTLRVKAGEQIKFVVTGGQPGKEATLLVFENETPLLDSNDDPVYIVSLRPGNNSFKTRSLNAGVCQAPNGCKYDIVNSGNPHSRPRDPWIILE